MNIGEKLKEARKEAKLSQKELSKRIGISQSVYSDYESGKVDPTAKVIILLCEELDLTADYLLGLEDEHGAKVQLYSNNHVDVKGDHNNVQIGNNIRR